MNTEITPELTNKIEELRSLNRYDISAFSKIQEFCTDPLLINHLQRKTGQLLSNISPKYFFQLLSEFQLETDPVIIDYFAIHMPEETLFMVPDRLSPSQTTFCIIKNPEYAQKLVETNHFTNKFSPGLQERIQQYINMIKY